MKSGDTDPWSGDDVPVAPGLGDIVWDTPSARAAADGIDAETVTDVVQPPSRRLVVPTVAVAALALVLLAIFAWPDGSEPVADDPGPSTPPASTTLGTLPPPTTSPPPTTVAESAVADPEVESTVFTEVAADELPPVLADAQLMTELAVVTDDGELVTLSFPSGIVTERVDLELGRASQFNSTPGILVLSPDSAMYAAGDDLVVVPTGGDVLAIERDDFADDGDTNAIQLYPFGWTTDVAGASVFVVISFHPSGRQSEWLVANDGQVSPAPAQRSGSLARPIYSLGTRFIDDAGGAYRVDPNGDSNRISSGEILATSETRLLLRECNANRVCNAVLRNYDGGEVRVVDLPPSFEPGFFAASLSPGGTAVTFADPSFTGERTIIDFGTGESRSFTDDPREVSAPTWAADGTGIFTFGQDGGIRFLDRATGEEFSFASEIGQIRAIATSVSTG